MRLKVETAQKSPSREGNGDAPRNVSTFQLSRKCYQLDAEEATRKLMEFLSRVLPEKRISVMYFDEAHKLGPHLCKIFLRIVQHQPPLTKMWYTFMGTKSSISYHAPPPRKSLSTASLACTCLTEAIVHSYRLKQEVARLPTPYIDLGFDQRAIAKSRAVSVRMGDMETIEFLSQYGRPLYVDLASKPQSLISLPAGVHICLKKRRTR